VERTLKHALQNAQDTVQQSMENSRREADMIVREAEMQAERILRDAKVRLADLKNDVLVVRAQKDSFARRLRHLLESQLELIGVLELDDLGFGEPDASPAGSRPATNPGSPGRKSVAQTAGRATATASRRVPSSKSTSGDGDKNLPSGSTRGQAGRLPLPSRETARASQNRPATDNDDEFHPVAEASNLNDGKRRFPKKQTKQETRISDHLIT